MGRTDGRRAAGGSITISKEAQWRRVVSEHFSDEGRAFITGRAVDEVLKRYGKTPLSHLIALPALRDHLERATESDIAEALSLAHTLEVTGPPYHIAPCSLLPRRFLESEAGPSDLQGRVDRAKEELINLSVSNLKGKAKTYGIPKTVLDATDDEDNPKEEVMKLIIGEMFKKQEKFRVAHFTLMADGIAQSSFPTFPRACLDFSRRSKLILDEVERMAPDVLTVAAVNHFEEFWEQEMGAIGYEGMFFPRYDESYPKGFQRPPPTYRRKPTDGCAIFVRSDLFTIGRRVCKRFADLTKDAEDTALVIVAEICKAPEEGESDKEDEDDEQDEKEKPHPPGLFTISVSQLERGESPAQLRRRIAQGNAWADLIEQFKGQGVQLVCGDIAETPTAEDGALSTLCKRFELQSAYAKGQGSDPDVTIADGVYRGCHDYILIPAVAQPWEIFSMPDFPEHLQLPLHAYPSGHFSLAAQLSFT